MTERPVWPKGQPLGNSPWETEALSPTTCAKPIPPLVELRAECTSQPYALRKTLSQRSQLSCVQIIDPQQLWDDKCVPFSASQFCDKFWSDIVGKWTWPPTHSNGAESLGEGAVACYLTLPVWEGHLLRLSLVFLNLETKGISREGRDASGNDALPLCTNVSYVGGLQMWMLERSICGNQPPRWLPIIQTSWYSCPCAVSQWVRADPWDHQKAWLVYVTSNVRS